MSGREGTLTEVVAVATTQESQGLHARNENVVLGDPAAAETTWASRALALGRDKPVPSSLVSCALVAKDISIPDHAGLLSWGSSLNTYVSTSTPAERKKVQNANVLTSPVKVRKVEDSDDGWNKMVLQQRSCLDQPGPSCLVSPPDSRQGGQPAGRRARWHSCKRHPEW